MAPFIIAATEETGSTGGAEALGLSFSAFLIQLITFVIVFLILNKFAFKPIGKKLEERRKVIDDGVKLGLELEKEREALKKEVAEIERDARHEADKIIATGHKEARAIMSETEKATARKTETMIADAEARIEEESLQAKLSLEKDIVGLISEATEALVGEKVDPKKDAELIDKILKGRIKK
jgi:F-type H+-transporting ATPase subunit b